MKITPEFNLVYGLGFFLEMLGLCSLIFAIYLVPHLFFGFMYPLPPIVFSVEWWLASHQHATAFHYGLIIFLPFLLTGVLCLFEAKNLTQQIEQQVLSQADMTLANRGKADYAKGGTAMLRTLLSVAVVFISIWLFATFFL